MSVHRVRDIVSSLALAMVATSAVAAPSSPAPMPVHVAGRVLRAPDGSLGFGWPGIYFESRFRGTGVEVAVESGTEFMRLLVDGEERAQLRRPGLARLTLQGLTPGEHVVRLEKQTESQVGGGRFIGFYPIDGAKALPPLTRPRRIEFIGDSHTAGYGDLSTVLACTREQVHDRTDGQQAFGPLLARRLDADYRVVAYSGFGMVRNYNATNPGLSLPAVYGRAIPDDPVHPSSTADGWRPQVVVINLGTNDFSTPLHPGEPWADQAALRAAYRDRYVAFVRALMADQPKAKFVLMGYDAFYDLVTEVATTLNDPARIATVHVAGLAQTGCDAHPSLADHEAMANLLQTTLDRFPNAWGEAPPR